MMPVEDQKYVYECYYVFALMWTIGGAVADDKQTPYRKKFSTWLKGNTKVKIPDVGDCFDYRFDPVRKEWVHWREFITEYSPVAHQMYQNIVVSSVELERMKYILDLHMAKKEPKPVLFVGIAGTGKTTIVKDYLSEIRATQSETTITAMVNHNSYTSSFALQNVLMSSLEKRAGRKYGPPAMKRCIYFVDDLNMPAMDKYETQSAIMLLTQILSYEAIYDRQNLEERRELADVQFCACMNPKAGAFMINGRLQRRFTVQTTFTPESAVISDIYSQILKTHLNSFPATVQKKADDIVNATIDVLLDILKDPTFLPSAKKFHYQFNLKDIANIFQGLLNTDQGVYKEANKFVRVWVHECNRVFGDRLIQKEDNAKLQEILEKAVGKHFSGQKEELFREPLILTSFVSVHGGNDKYYNEIRDIPELSKCLEEKLIEYNNTYAAMELVLFQDAMQHICRIARIIDLPCGHALLVGVGGSGKQSLSRVAAFIVGTDILTILVNQSYGQAELKVDLQEMYKKAAVKPGTQHAFLMTDGQIADERFLVFINDMLSSGNIPDLFTREEYDAFFGAIRNLAKSQGVPDERDSLMSFFIDRVRRNLHMILCHSPVGDTFRIRGRKFPALISCMVVDEFMAWPKDALTGVCLRFIGALGPCDGDNETPNIPTDELLDGVANMMGDIHLSIDEANAKFLASERRHNYTTPKSFLELIAFYSKMLKTKQLDVTTKKERLEKGLTIMEQVSEKVTDLKEFLRVQMIQVEEKKVTCAGIVEQVNKETAVAEEIQAAAAEEEAKTSVLAAEAKAISDQAAQDLSKAEPAMKAAEEAVDCLNKNAIGELKGFGKPPPECVEVCQAVAFTLGYSKKAIDWKAAQKMMGNPGAFLDEVKAYNKEEIPADVLEKVRPYLAKDFFNYETMKSKSFAAANLTNWIINVVAFYDIYVNVKPLMEKKAAAEAQLEEAMVSLKAAQDKKAAAEAKVADLNKTLSEAEAEKSAVEEEAEKGAAKLALANRLVVGLADEQKRWTNTVADLREEGMLLIGNCLLASGFVGYISPFSSEFRIELWRDIWTAGIKENKIPIFEGIDPLYVLASESNIAGWGNEGLPADRVSIENAAVLTQCDRWPLMIDPQLQGVKWIKSRYGEELEVVQLTQKKWLNKVKGSIRDGKKLLIESVGSEIDAILDPLLSRSIIRKGKAKLMNIGGDELEYDDKFGLVLQSKLPNPHYRPEIAAQCTIINFIVTPKGLEDQILAIVVNVEKPELEQKKQELVREQNNCKVQLSELEDQLLAQLSKADPATILDNVALIEGLEVTKETSKEITKKVQAALVTEEEINTSRELYRPVAAEGSMLFFLIIQLCIVEHMYQYSLDSFVSFLNKAIEKTPFSEDTAQRSLYMIDTIRMTIFKWVNRGLFERHKLIFCAMLTFRLFALGKLKEECNPVFLSFLLRGPLKEVEENPIAEWLPKMNWQAVNALTDLEGFDTFAQNMTTDAPARFREWFNEPQPESTKLPLDWKRLDSTPFQKLLVIRCLRPDRMTTALGDWIRKSLPNGVDYMDCDQSNSFFEVLNQCSEDSSNTTPIFFILSPGADPVKEVEAMGRKKVQNFKAGVNYHNVAMGQGQDVVAEQKLDQGHKEGHWVMLQNVHLMPRWCVSLEKRLDDYMIDGSNPDFRLFLSADPSKGIPIGILERSIKLTNEPPQGLSANLRRAFANFPKEDFEDRDSKVKSILFGLCFFHSLMLERKKFGPLGYNMMYPFSAGDLRDSASVLYNYLESQASLKIPFEDLKYIFGDIMYGGHIVDDWDRRVCSTYLNYFMVEELLEEHELVPYADGKLSYISPQPGGHEKYLEHIATIPPESPIFFGMHPNAEINFRTNQCNELFEQLQQLQPKGGAAAGDEGQSPMQVVEQLVNDILENTADIQYDVDGISKGIPDEEKGPTQFVFLQECDLMNGLIGEMKRSLLELQLGIRGELTMSEQMEDLSDCLFFERISPRWQKKGFPTTRALKSWLNNLKTRSEQLQSWTDDPMTPLKCVDISLFFNPQSFLTALKQITCQLQQMELDKLQVYTDVTKKADSKAVTEQAKDGAFVTGMWLEGARWETATNTLEDSKPKEMFDRMPVVNCKAGLASDKEIKDVYQCPCYATPQRRPYYVFTAQLRTKQTAAKWTLGGVALILDVGLG
jgi:dynein heavy chain